MIFFLFYDYNESFMLFFSTIANITVAALVVAVAGDNDDNNGV